MVMRLKAKGLMVIVTFCLVTQGSTQKEAECRGDKLDLAGRSLEYGKYESLMHVCKEMGKCKILKKILDRKEDKLKMRYLRDNLLRGREIWTRRIGDLNTTLYWIPRKGLQYFDRVKRLPINSAYFIKQVHGKIDAIMGRIIKHDFYICIGGTLAPPVKPPVERTTPRRATTSTTRRTTGVTTVNETSTESDDSGDGIDPLMLYTVIGVFAFAAALATCFCCCGARKKNRQEHSSESSINRRSHYSRATRSKSMVSKMSRKSGRSMSNVSRSSQKRRKSRRVSSESEDSSSSTSSVDFSKSAQRYDRSSSVTGFTTQSSIGIVKDLFKGAKTQRQITESISKKENVVKKENAVKQELENLKRKRRLSKYDRV